MKANGLIPIGLKQSMAISGKEHFFLSFRVLTHDSDSTFFFIFVHFSAERRDWYLCATLRMEIGNELLLVAMKKRFIDKS